MSTSIPLLPAIVPLHPTPDDRPSPRAEVEVHTPSSRRTARDDNRLATLLRDHHRTVWRMVRRLGVPPASCDDATQQVYLIASDKLGDIRAGSERSFLLGTAVRVAANARRLAHVRREQAEDDDSYHADPSPAADVLVDQKRMREMLDEVLDGLEGDLRTVLVLHELEGMSAPAIAEVLEIPAGTVASRLRRAREEFQSCARRVRARFEHQRGV